MSPSQVMLVHDLCTEVATLEANLAVAREALGRIAEGDMPETYPDGSKRWFNGGEGGWKWAREKAAAALKEIAQ